MGLRETSLSNSALLGIRGRTDDSLLSVRFYTAVMKDCWTFVNPPDLFGSEIPFKTCHILYSIGTWVLVSSICCAEAILVLRTFALSGNNLRLLALLLSSLVGIVMIPGIVIVAKFLQSVQYGRPPIPGITGCYTTAESPIVLYGFVVVFLNEFVIMVVTLWIGIWRYRRTQNRIVKTLYKDGISYFVYLAMVSFGNILVLVVGGHELIDLLVTFQPVMHSILSTRVLLHVRQAAGKNSIGLREDDSRLEYIDYSVNVTRSGLRFQTVVTTEGESII